MIYRTKCREGMNDDTAVLGLLGLLWWRGDVEIAEADITVCGTSV